MCHSEIDAIYKPRARVAMVKYEWRSREAHA
jgi:hypothetical protein